MHYNPQIVVWQAPSASLSAGAHKLGRKAKSHNLFRIRTSEKHALNSFRIRTCKSKRLKVLYNPHLQKKEGEGSLLLTCHPKMAFPPDHDRHQALPPPERRSPGDRAVGARVHRQHPPAAAGAHRPRIPQRRVQRQGRVVQSRRLGQRSPRAEHDSGGSRQRRSEPERPSSTPPAVIPGSPTP